MCENAVSFKSFAVLFPAVVLLASIATPAAPAGSYEGCPLGRFTTAITAESF